MVRTRRSVERLQQISKWMKVNREAVDAAQPVHLKMNSHGEALPNNQVKCI